MNFSELESLMSSRGVTSLADIARTLDTTPQAVSNWKARDQIPYHVIAKLNQLNSNNSQVTNQTRSQQLAANYSPLTVQEENTLSLFDILLTMAEQFKLILLVPFITVFLTFTYVRFVQEPIYVSSSTILLPGNKEGIGNLAGIASQFGLVLPQGAEADLSSPSLFPELIRSRTFAERILGKTFFSEKYGKDLTMLAILNHGDAQPQFERDTLIQKTLGTFNSMIKLEPTGSFSMLSVESADPQFARDVNKEVLIELQALNRFFKSQHVNEKTDFIENRIGSVKNDLENSEQTLKYFREQNQQISSPALQLEQERLARDVEIQKGIYLTLKQQLELAKIEEIQKTSIVQILDEPQVPLEPSNKNLKLNVIISGILGIGLGILLGFIRAYTKNADMYERRKLRRVKTFIKKKGKSLIMDRRVFGILIIVLLIGLPFYLGHQSKNPVFFGMYSSKLMFLNIVYLFTILLLVGSFIYLSRNKN